MNNQINDNGVQREMTDEEQAAHDSYAAQVAADEIVNQKAAKAAAAARQAVLDKLGLTADEITALLL